MKKLLLCFIFILLIFGGSPLANAQYSDERSGSETMLEYAGPDVWQIIEYGMQFVGVPYVLGGTSQNGFDCSGFVQYIFAKHGIYLPRTADAQFEHGHWVSEKTLNREI